MAEDTGALFNLVTNVLVNLISDSVTLLAIIGVLFWINWQLAVLMMLVMPLFIFNYRLSRKRLRKLSRRHRRNWDRGVACWELLSWHAVL